MSDNYGSPGTPPNPPMGVPGNPRPVFGFPPTLPAAPTNPPPPPPASGAFFARQPPEPAAPSDSGGQSGWRKLFWILPALAVAAGLVVYFTIGASSERSAIERIDDTATSDGESDGFDEESESEGPSFFADPVRPDSVAIDASSVWVSDAACGVVVQIDKATEEVVGAVNIGGPASGVAVAAGSVWVGGRDLGSVFRIDTQLLTVAESVGVPGFALGLTAEGNDVWVTDSLLGSVHRIDAAGSALAETVQVGADPHHIAIGSRTVWVTNQDDDTVSMIPRGRGGSAVTVAVGNSPLHVELGAGSAWVTDSSDRAVRRLDENTGETLAIIDVGIWPHALAFANGFVWVGTENGSFWKIDPATNEASRVDDADFTSIDTAVDGNNVWVADASGGAVVRFDAVAGAVGSVIDLREFGDCQTFQDEAFNPPSPDISL